MFVKQDFFELWSHLRFLKKYRKSFGYFHMIRVCQFGNSEERALHERAESGQDEKYITSKKFVKHNSLLMSFLALHYNKVQREAADWLSCTDYHGGRTHNRNGDLVTYMRWIDETQDICQSLFNQRKTNILYDALARFCAIPFTFLELLIGYDIRKQPAYKTWISMIIVGAAFIALLNYSYDVVIKVMPIIQGIAELK